MIRFGCSLSRVRAHLYRHGGEHIRRHHSSSREDKGEERWTALMWASCCWHSRCMHDKHDVRGMGREVEAEKVRD